LTRRVETGRLIHRDYDFEHPWLDLTTESADPRGHLFDHYTRFHYPGDYTQPAANTLERLQRHQETVLLSGRVRTAAPGHRLTLSEHPRADQNRELTLIAVSYDIADNDYEASGESTDSRFQVEVEAIPASSPFRPPLITPKPRTRGVETAVVVGPEGEEIYTDEYGRVKVHFHWDRYGQRDGSDSCWMRVASPWAGSNFGAIHIPRIGQEVIVDFEHGDPDRPIITGRVYNAAQMPPWDLPANKTQSGLLTRSSTGGAAGAGARDGPGDANALRFEDKKGREEVWFHAQKDYLTEVEHDESKWVGHDRRKEIDRDEFSTIHRDRTEEVDRNEIISIHGWRKEEVDQDETITIHQNRYKTIDHSETDRIGDSWNMTTGKTRMEHVGVLSMLNVGMTHTENVGMLHSSIVAGKRIEVSGLGKTETVSGPRTAEVKSDTLTVEQAQSVSAKRIHLSASEEIVLNCGSSSIRLTPDLIRILSDLVKLNC